MSRDKSTPKDASDEIDAFIIIRYICVFIPKDNILSPDKKEDIFKQIAGISSAYHTTEELYQIMNSQRITVGQGYVSFMDLFVGGLTNSCSDLFCGISVLSNLVDLRGKCPVYYIGDSELNFLWEFIKFIAIENLAVVNFDACLYDWEERMIVPQILVSLTYRGILYRDYVDNKHPNTVSEAFISMHLDESWDDRIEKLTIV